mmetsp:Transcript_129416/g.414808  ORF Transcript_129416/g.414808 Transcript_129416/m.414808 type:complete len:283 (+) Transcript_129416:2210-3058(+)
MFLIHICVKHANSGSCKCDACPKAHNVFAKFWPANSLCFSTAAAATVSNRGAFRQRILANAQTTMDKSCGKKSPIRSELRWAMSANRFRFEASSTAYAHAVPERSCGLQSPSCARKALEIASNAGPSWHFAVANAQTDRARDIGNISGAKLPARNTRSFQRGSCAMLVSPREANFADRCNAVTTWFGPSSPPAATMPAATRSTPSADVCAMSSPWISPRRSRERWRCSRSSPRSCAVLPSGRLGRRNLLEATAPLYAEPAAPEGPEPPPPSWWADEDRRKGG